MRRAGGSGPARAASRRPSRAGRADGRRSPWPYPRRAPAGLMPTAGTRIRSGSRRDASVPEGGTKVPAASCPHPVRGRGTHAGPGSERPKAPGAQFIIAPAQDEFHDSFARARREAAGQEHLFAFGPRASDNFIGGDFVPHGDIHGDSTGVAPLGEGEDTPLDGGGMAFPLGGVKGFTCAYQLGTQDISFRYGVAGGRTRRGRGGRGKGHGAPLSNLKQ